MDTVGFIGLGLAFNRWMYRIRARVFLKHVRGALRLFAFDSKNMRVLDAGAGSGFYLDLWKAIGARRISACDFTDSAVQWLSTQYAHVDVRRGDLTAEEPPFSPCSFDAVSCMDVIFHIVNDAAYDRALHNLSAMLRPGGLLIFTENFVHVPAVRGAQQTSRSLTEIEALVHAADLEIIMRRPMFVLMNAPVDSSSGVLHLWWKMATAIAARAPGVAAALGMLVYPLEVGLTTILPEGPSTEIMICRKRRAP